MMKKFTSENSSVTAKQNAVASRSLAVNSHSQESIGLNASPHIVQPFTISASEIASEILSTATTPLQLDPESHEVKMSFTPEVPPVHMLAEEDEPAMMKN